jgi:hypothetical protein
MSVNSVPPVDKVAEFIQRFKFRASDKPYYIASQKTGQCYYDSIFNILYFGEPFNRYFGRRAIQIFEKMPIDLLRNSGAYKDECLAVFNVHDTSFRDTLAGFTRRYILVKLVERGATPKDITDIGVYIPLEIVFTTHKTLFEDQINTPTENKALEEYSKHVYGRQHGPVSKGEKFYSKLALQKTKEVPGSYKGFLQSNPFTSPIIYSKRRKSLNTFAGPLVMAELLCEDTPKTAEQILDALLLPVYGKDIITVSLYPWTGDFIGAHFLFRGDKGGLHAISIVKNFAKWYILDNNIGIALPMPRDAISEFTGYNLAYQYGYYISPTGPKRAARYVFIQYSGAIYDIARIDTDENTTFDVSTFTPFQTFKTSITEPLGNNTFIYVRIEDNVSTPPIESAPVQTPPVESEGAAARPQGGGKRRKTRRRVKRKGRK